MAKRLVLVWTVATFWLADAPLSTLAHFFSQYWPTCGQRIGQPKYWLAKILVGQAWAQTKHTLRISN
jgi:hypothetical protein